MICNLDHEKKKNIRGMFFVVVGGHCHDLELLKVMGSLLTHSEIFVMPGSHEFNLMPIATKSSVHSIQSKNY